MMDIEEYINQVVKVWHDGVPVLTGVLMRAGGRYVVQQKAVAYEIKACVFNPESVWAVVDETHINIFVAEVWNDVQ